MILIQRILSDAKTILEGEGGCKRPYPEEMVWITSPRLKGVDKTYEDRCLGMVACPSESMHTPYMMEWIVPSN